MLIGTATVHAPLHFNFGLTSDVDRDTVPVRSELPTSGIACRFLIVVTHLKALKKAGRSINGQSTTARKGEEKS